MERLIPIEITGARIEKLAIEFKEDGLPEWQAEVVLLMPNKEKLTSIYVRTNDWPDDKRAERSLEFINLAGQLRNEIHTLVTQHMNKFQKTLEVQT